MIIIRRRVKLFLVLLPFFFFCSLRITGTAVDELHRQYIFYKYMFLYNIRKTKSTCVQLANKKIITRDDVGGLI